MLVNRFTCNWKVKPPPIQKISQHKLTSLMKLNIGVSKSRECGNQSYLPSWHMEFNIYITESLSNISTNMILTKLIAGYKSDQMWLSRQGVRFMGSLQNLPGLSAVRKYKHCWKLLRVQNIIAHIPKHSYLGMFQIYYHTSYRYEWVLNYRGSVSPDRLRQGLYIHLILKSMEWNTQRKCSRHCTKVYT